MTTLQAFCDYIEAKPAWIDKQTHRIVEEACWMLLWGNAEVWVTLETDIRTLDLAECVKGAHRWGLDESNLIQENTLRTYRNELRGRLKAFLKTRPRVKTLKAFWQWLEATSFRMQMYNRRSAWRRLIEPLMLPDDTDVRDVPWDRLLDPDIRLKPLLDYYRHWLELAFEQFLAEQDPSPAGAEAV